MSDTITGSTIADRYKVTGQLRSGRMGDVYVARRRDDGRRVSVKILDPSLFDNPEAVQRFERETRITRTIEHPCSMKVLDFGQSSVGPYLILEYVEGDLLSDLIDEQPVPTPERSARIAAQIAMALRAAHAAGVIHRDLAPSNVLVASQGSHRDIVKVTDFGLSLLTHTDDETENTNLTAVGVRIGTPTYMAPEYIEEYELDHRADIYGLGVMLFEMLAGTPPYTGRPYKVMDQHVNAEVPRPSSKASDIPEWLDDLVVSMMQKDPDDRVQTAAEVVAAIEAGLGAPVEVHAWVSPTAQPPPQRAVRAPTPTVSDPILTHLIDTHTLGLERSDDRPPARHRLMVVTRVSPVSIAGSAGIQPGWQLHLPDEDAKSGLLDPELLTSRVVDERRYHFFPPEGGRVELRATGIPIGIEAIRSVANVNKNYDPLVPVPSALLDLWRQGEWADLEKLAWRTVTQQKGSASLLSSGLFARLLGSDKPKLVDHPAALLFGIALFEQDRADEGMPWVTEFQATHAGHWPTLYSALALLYLARDKVRNNTSDLAPDLARQAYFQSRLPAAQQLHASLTDEALNPSPWLGQSFSDYSMDSSDERHSARLSLTCSEMDGSQLLAVCMMGGFRGSLDYDALMFRYSTFAAYFGEFLYQLHVVSTVQEREPSKPEHYRGEDFAIAAGVNHLVLHDYRAFVQRAIKPASIPTIYLLDKLGTVVHEGPLTACDLWDALAEAGRLRVERLQARG